MCFGGKNLRWHLKAYLKISIGYLIIAATWIIVSDSLLSLIAINQTELSNLQTFKGWFFVIVTTLLLFSLSKRWMNNLEHSYENEKQSRIKLEKTEVQLRKKEELNRILIEQAADSIFVLDVDGKIIELNKKAECLVSRTGVKVHGQKLADFLMNEHENSVTSNEINDLSGEKILRTEDVEIYVDLNSAKLSDDRVMVIARDITEKRKTQLQLKEMHDYLEGIINASPAAILLVSPDGKVGHIWNKAAEEIFQWKHEEVIGKILPVVPDEKRNEFFSFFKRVLNGETLYGIEVARIKKDGSTVNLYLSAAPIFGNDGKVVQVVSVITDVTDKVLAREELKQSEQKLRSLAQHLQNVREQERAAIARELHDELGQILTSLKISLNFMSREVLSNTAQFDEMSFKNEIDSMNGMLDQSTQRLRKLISELRTDILDNLGLKSAIDYELKQFIENSGIKCSVKYESIDDTLKTEKANTILRVLQESFTNIKKHSNAKSVEVSVIKNNGTIKLIVSDDGVGFNFNAIKNKNTFGLLGMKERTQAVDGSLIVESKPGIGTKIELELKSE